VTDADQHSKSLTLLDVRLSWSTAANLRLRAGRLEEALCAGARRAVQLGQRGHGQVAPADRALDADGDDRMLSDQHRLELRVAGPKQRLRIVVLTSLSEDLGAPAQHDPAELLPVLIVVIDDDGDRWVLGNIAQAILRRRLSVVPPDRFGFSSMVM